MKKFYIKLVKIKWQFVRKLQVYGAAGDFSDLNSAYYKVSVPVKYFSPQICEIKIVFYTLFEVTANGLYVYDIVYSFTYSWPLFMHVNTISNFVTLHYKLRLSCSSRFLAVVCVVKHFMAIFGFLLLEMTSETLVID